MKKFFVLKGLLTASLIIGSSFFTSCGGGSSNNTQTNNNTGGTGSSTSLTYLPYKSSLYLVNPANPTQPLQITTQSIGDHTTFYKVDNVNTANFTYQNLRYHSLVYIENSKVYSVNLEISSAAPTAKQISQITRACAIESEYEDTKAGIGYLVVKVAGQDSQCNTSDDKKMFINTDMSSSNSPIDISNVDVVAKIKGTDIVSVSGFLVGKRQETSYKIQKCNINLTNCSDLLTGISDGENIGESVNNRDFYGCAKTASPGSSYHVFKFDGNSISDTGVVCDVNNWRDNKKDTHEDSTGIYVIDSNGNLYKFNLNNYQTTQLYNGGDLNEITVASENRLVVRNNNGNYLVLSKSNGTILKTFNTPDYVMKTAQQNRIFYTNIQGAYPNYTYSACYLDDSSVNSNCLSGYAWIGYTTSKNGNYHIKNDETDIYKLIAVKTSTKTIYSLDPSNPGLSNSIQLGTLPSSYIPNRGHSLGKYVLLPASDSSNNNRKDIFFANVSTQGSLQQVTNTPNIDESLL